jgi:hypothetical protein
MTLRLDVVDDSSFVAVCPTASTLERVRDVAIDNTPKSERTRLE